MVHSVKNGEFLTLYILFYAVLHRTGVYAFVPFGTNVKKGMVFIMAQLTCRDLALGYDGKRVVQNLTFAVETGNYLCIVGENGSGKSTLIKAILRLVPPLSGSICLGDGVQPREIGYLPQQSAAQRDFPASVQEIVLSGCLNRCGLRPFYTRSEKELANANMKRLGIESLSRRCYRELSGGQQQRVLLARALCATRKLLLLDEPAAGLDPTATAELYQLIETLNCVDKITVIMITHDMAAVAKYASHILHIGGKEQLFFGTAEAYAQSGLDREFQERQSHNHDTSIG